ncbi:MAG: lipase family protein [Gammaproteobacteria bacterium]
MNLYQHFEHDGTSHSSTAAYLLALPCYFIYETAISWSSNFQSGFGNLMKLISGNDADAFSLRFFTRSSVLAFDSPQVWNPVVGYDAQAAVLHNDDVVIICFRGSESPTSYDGFRDWFGTNLTFQLQDAPSSWGRGVRVHRGFYVTLDALYQGIRNHILSLANTRKVYLTGHSTGGALATLCGYRLQYVGGVNVEAVYSFGAPRIGNNGFAQSYTQLLGNRTYRWVNRFDLGAQVPDISAPPTPTAGIVPIEPYVHVGRLNYIEANGSVTHDLLDHDPIMGAQQLGEIFKYHDMIGYLYKTFDELSNASRVNANSPAELVRDDVKMAKLKLGRKTRSLMDWVGPRP